MSIDNITVVCSPKRLVEAHRLLKWVYLLRKIVDEAINMYAKRILGKLRQLPIEVVKSPLHVYLPFKCLSGMVSVGGVLQGCHYI